jgi:hypothetical protein
LSNIVSLCAGNQSFLPLSLLVPEKDEDNKASMSAVEGLALIDLALFFRSAPELPFPDN